MKCMLGFVLFWIGIGMLIKVFLPDSLCVFIIIGALIGVGFWLYRDKNRSSRKWDRFFCSLKSKRR